MPTLPAGSNSASQLLRESTSPTSVKSPAAQYYSPTNTRWEIVQGENGAPYAIPAGYDGTNYRPFLVDSSGRPIVPVASSQSFTAGADATSVAASGGTFTWTFAASAGTIAEVYFLGLYIPAVSGSTTGTHSIAAYYGSSGTYAAQTIMLQTQNYNTDLSLVTKGTEAANGNVTMNPTPFIIFGNGTSEVLRIIYTNNTDAAQGGVKRYWLGKVERFI